MQNEDWRHVLEVENKKLREVLSKLDARLNFYNPLIDGELEIEDATSINQVFGEAYELLQEYGEYERENAQW